MSVRDGNFPGKRQVHRETGNDELRFLAEVGEDLTDKQKKKKEKKFESQGIVLEECREHREQRFPVEGASASD